MATVKSLLANDKPILCIDPMENIIVGGSLICQYLGITSATTMAMWHEQYGLPVTKRPDGQWMTSMTAIDWWIFQTSIADVHNRPYSRGTNRRGDIALAHAQRRAERLKRYQEHGVPVPTGPAMSATSDEKLAKIEDSMANMGELDSPGEQNDGS